MKKRTQAELDWLFLMICAADIGSQALKKLLDTLGSPTDILNAGRRAVVSIVGEEISKKFFSDKYREIFDVTCHWLETTSMTDVVTWSDSDYPRELLHVEKAPTVLWIRGRRELLSKSKVFVTGTESPDAEGIQNAFEFSHALAQKGYAIVTGLAFGIETEATRGALIVEKNAIVVQSTGADRLYPKENRDLFVTVAEEGLVVSPLPLTTGFKGEQRFGQLELMAALSQKVLFVQTHLGCSALIAAKTSAELGRDVCAIPGSIHSPLYKGNHHLLKQGAQLVESVSDILDL